MPRYEWLVNPAAGERQTVRNLADSVCHFIGLEQNSVIRLVFKKASRNKKSETSFVRFGFTIGKAVFDGRVRNGIGSDHSLATKKRSSLTPGKEQEIKLDHARIAFWMFIAARKIRSLP